MRNKLYMLTLVLYNTNICSISHSNKNIWMNMFTMLLSSALWHCLHWYSVVRPFGRNFIHPITCDTLHHGAKNFVSGRIWTWVLQFHSLPLFHLCYLFTMLGSCSFIPLHTYYIYLIKAPINVWFHSNFKKKLFASFLSTTQLLPVF